jgi:PmbA protein
MSEAVAYSGLTLFDDPTDQRWFGAVPFDGEGLATRRNALLTDGVLTSYLLDSWSARAMNTVSNASAVRGGIHSTPGAGPQSLVIEPGQQSAEQIIAGVDDGLLITEVQGLHSGVNTVSGDFSAGIEGRAIRSGKLCEPIKEVTIASTLQRMLADITAIGSDLTTVPIDAVGVTMAIGDVMVSGDSA